MVYEQYEATYLRLRRLKLPAQTTFSNLYDAIKGFEKQDNKTLYFLYQAAHCLDDIVQTSVYVGIIDRINGPAVWGITINDRSNLIIHESYSTVNLGYDIALVRLVNTIKNDPNVGIISLPRRSEVSTSLEGRMATIAGFGRYTDKSGPSEKLRFVQNQIVANTVCEKTFGKANIQASTLCLEGTGGKSSCQGDSGGGLHLELNGRKVVIGVVSFGAESGCTLNYPAVYTRVTSFLDWIQGKTGIRIE